MARALGGTGREGFRGRPLLETLVAEVSGFFQECGPPPLVKRRKAWSTHVWAAVACVATKPQLPGSHGSLLVCSRVEDGRQSKGQGMTHGTADKGGYELESASTALECLEQIDGVKLRQAGGCGSLSEWLAVG